VILPCLITAGWRSAQKAGHRRGAFDLGDMGAEIAKQHVGLWSGEGFRSFAHANPTEDPGHGGRE